MCALNSNSLALSVVSNFRRSLRVASPRTFARACVFRPPPPPQSPSPKLEPTPSLPLPLYIKSNILKPIVFFWSICHFNINMKTDTSRQNITSNQFTKQVTPWLQRGKEQEFWETILYVSQNFYF